MEWLGVTPATDKSNDKLHQTESENNGRSDYDNYLVFSNGWKLSGCQVPVPPYSEWPNYSYVMNAPDGAAPDGWWPDGYLKSSKTPRTVQAIELR